MSAVAQKEVPSRSALPRSSISQCQLYFIEPAILFSPFRPAVGLRALLLCRATRAAARVLLLDRDNVEGLLVGMPERDVLWLGNDEGQNLGDLMSMNEQQSLRADHPLSTELFRVTDGEFVPVRPTGTER